MDLEKFVDINFRLFLNSVEIEESNKLGEFAYASEIEKERRKLEKDLIQNINGNVLNDLMCYILSFAYSKRFFYNYEDRLFEFEIFDSVSYMSRCNFCKNLYLADEDSEQHCTKKRVKFFNTEKPNSSLFCPSYDSNSVLLSLEVDNIEKTLNHSRKLCIKFERQLQDKLKDVCFGEIYPEKIKEFIESYAKRKFKQKPIDFGSNIIHISSILLCM